MIKRATVCFALLALAGRLLSQSPAAMPQVKPSGASSAFAIADIHTSEHSNTPKTTGGMLHGDRYNIHQVTMTNLIARAYGVEDTYVLGGPAWLDLDRFEIVAQAPRTTVPADVELMLRGLLTDRFKLVAHASTKPLPAFVLTEGKGAMKLKQAEPSAEPGASPEPGAPNLLGCQFQPPPPNTQQTPNMELKFSCHAVTMEAFTQFLHQVATPYLKQPVVDLTGLKGAWDFDIHWAYQPPQQGGAGGTTIFDAVEKQLGLKLEARIAPLPVVMVDSVNETPTPNPPGIEKALPPPPPSAFDVAVVKPAPPDEKGINMSLRGSEIVINGATLQFLITWAWDISDGRIVNRPDFLNRDHWDILGKVAVDASPAFGGPPPIDFEDLQQMVKTLLADRFALKSHTEERPADAFTLVADKPHMTKADPANRTGCKDGPGPDGKDPRINNPQLGRLVTCSNMTMTQFAAQLQSMAPGFIKNQVIDATGIEGAYDFTLSFSKSGQLTAAAKPASSDDSGSPASASEPTGGISLADAINKTLGLKLEKRKGTMPMFVIDHIDPQPTEN